MAETRPTEWTGVDAGLAVVVGWLIPGAGHFYLRRRRKALALFVLVLGTYFAGLALSRFQCVFYRTTPMLKSRLWFYGQAGVGLPTGILSLINQPKTETREAELRYELRDGFEIGTLWTTIAGLLNLLAVVDVYDVYYKRRHPRPAEEPSKSETEVS